MEDNGRHVGAASNPMEPDPAKIFIGGLHSQTDEESLRHYFEKYGEVKECTVMRDLTTQRSRGFGFAIFKDPLSIDKVLDESQHHVIDGKKVDPKRAIPKKPPPGQAQNYRKIFVGGLPPEITQQEVTEYFEVYGKVTDVLLVHDRNTKRLRGFGFVTFESEAAAKSVCETGFHKLKGKNVECKRAQPKEVMMLQGKGRDLLVNLAPFPFNRSFPNNMTSPVTFGVPEWSPSPQLYQHLVNWMSLGRGKAYTTGHYTTPPQGFGNMPDHRRSNQQYLQEYSNSASHTTAVTTAETLSPQTQDYDHPVQIHQFATQPSSTVVPTPPHISHANIGQQQQANRQSDIGSFLPNRSGFNNDHQHQLYHGAQAMQSSQAFGHSLPPITLRH